MKKSICFLLMVLTVPVLLTGQSGKVYDNLSMKSQILKMDRKYAVYLPPDYESSGRSYPVLYLLHGGGDDQTGWVQFGEVMHITDKAIKEGKSTPLIIVMPDANTGRRGYFNSMKGDFQYEDFFFREFIPFIEKTYRIRAEKQYRAVAGLSMGGGGTILYALHHPEMFAAACPLSASVRTSSAERGRIAAADTAGLTTAQVTGYLNQHNALYLIENMPDDQKTAVRWYIDCGDDDFLYEGNSLMHIAMRKKEIPHEYRVRDGGHTWQYWREALPEVLDFISRAFHR
ncbi:MAG TPA: alpha/beta hydrolase-fold protein [Bacteroidales bacterium]|jgi:enterochelin esterase-like enzyme|nr:alpha/beta hydrolase-fold protein [Bacteroidales bacterium]HQH24412.1 alpha/beta hydrolase-fold protein [Bacteroidales bacterium]HQJ81455.1 alpha/beta hydrolase-fold protein [Bacteroidales bacterium]